MADRAYREGRLIMDSKQDLVDRIAALEAERDALRAALEPFAGAAAIFDIWHEAASDNYPLSLEHVEGQESFHVTIGQLRTARRTLEQTGDRG